MPKRGLIVLVLTWSVLLFAPIFKLQTQQSWYLSDEGRGALMQDPTARIDWRKLARSHPQNGLLAFQDLSNNNDPHSARYWRELDAIIARFPDDLNVRRARLLDSTRDASLVRPFYTPVASRATEIKNSDEWQNQSQRAAIVRAARAGEKQAPDDGFFPWMEAMALWNRNDEAALKALQRATKMTQFDDGVMANRRALLAWGEQLSPLQWDEKLDFIFAATFPHYSQVRALAREVAWSGIARYKRGDKAGAYRRWKIALQAGGALRRAESRGSQSFIIGLYRAEGTQSAMWRIVSPELNPPARINGRLDNTSAANLRAFEQLARRDGHGELANYAAAQYAQFEARKIGSGDNMDMLDKSLGLRSPSSRLTLQLPWVERSILWLGIVGALSLLACLIWQRFVGGARWPKASGAQIAFFGALWVSALVLAVWQIAVSQIQQTTMSQFDNSIVPWLGDALKGSWPFGLAIALTWLSAMALCYLQEARDQRRLRDQTLPLRKGARVGFSLWTIVIGSVWSAVLLSGFLWGVVLGNSEPTFGLIWTLFSVLAITLSIYRVECGDVPQKNRARLCVVSAACALTAFGIRGWFDISSYDTAFYSAGASLFAGIAILIYLGATATVWRPLFSRALATALQTLGGVAALCALALLIASLAALPVRARQNRIVDDYIQRGEIDWMRSQMQTQRASQSAEPNSS